MTLRCQQRALPTLLAVAPDGSSCGSSLQTLVWIPHHWFLIPDSVAQISRRQLREDTLVSATRPGINPPRSEPSLGCVPRSPIAAGRSKATRGCQIDSRLCLDFCSLGGNLGCGDEYFRMWGLGISMATCLSSTRQSKHSPGCVCAPAVCRHLRAELRDCAGSAPRSRLCLPPASLLFK